MMGFPLESYSKSFTGAYRSGTLACILVCRFSVVFRFSALESLSVSCVGQYTIELGRKNGASDASDKIGVALPCRTR